MDGSCDGGDGVVDSDWTCYRDDDIIQQQNAIQAEEALKTPFVGNKVRSTKIKAHTLILNNKASFMFYFLYGDLLPLQHLWQMQFAP